jgi:uncharacterized protein
LSSYQFVVHTLEVILKVVERCNIACDYCYYFSMGDATALGRPATMGLMQAVQIADWLAEGCRAVGVQRLLVCFHGGEPMMMGKRKFDDICELFRSKLKAVPQLCFSIQTNGTLIDDEWISSLDRYGVHVGVSIDGAAEAHDRHRRGHKGESTFEKTANGLSRLIKAASAGAPHIGPSTISVLDARNDYSATYRYLRAQGIGQMNFLLPDRNRDQKVEADDLPERYGKAMLDIFTAWMTEDDPSVRVRFIDDALRSFSLNGRAVEPNRPPSVDGERSQDNSQEGFARQVIIAYSDATVGISDSYIPALGWFQQMPRRRVGDVSMLDYLRDGVFAEIERLVTTLSKTCQSCGWKRLCRGGDIENRYSSVNGFDNPSAYCEGYKLFFSGMHELLLANGYPAPEALRALASA